MSKRRSKTAKSDSVAEFIAQDEQVTEEEFPDGFVYFSIASRLLSTYIIPGEVTHTGKSYQIERTGTKVDIKDMECLKALRTSVFCQIQGKHIEITPIGVTSI